MLTIKAEGTAGTDLRAQMIPEMIDLARRVRCRVEVEANGCQFWARPTNTVQELQEAYDRLYPTSRIIAVGISNPVPKLP